MSWGTGSYFAYNLSEKVWISMGLSPRCFGNSSQRVVYDDLVGPEFSVAEGEISNSYYFTASRNVSWTMRNDYLRRYLWMRGAAGMRAFYYEALLEDVPEIRAIMKGESHYQEKPDAGWYELDLREWEGKLLLQVWATVSAVSPKLCLQPDIHKLVWPDDDKPMTQKRLGEVAARSQPLYLKDTFLERYEQNGIYKTVPVKTVDGIWLCSPSYAGQWSFTRCRRVGRNHIRVEAYDLYKGVPDREILHAHAFAVAPKEVARLSLDEEHIVAKAQRLLEQLLDLGDNLSTFGHAVGVAHKSAAELVGFSRAEVQANGWLRYPMLCRLGQVAPLNMTQQAFLSRCKTLHEILQKVPNTYLKSLLKVAGCEDAELKDRGSLTLLQGLLNILQELHGKQDDASAFSGAAAAIDWSARNDAMAALFVLNELRIADAHHAAPGWLLRLEELGYDTAQVNDGYGQALDFILDRVSASLDSFNERLSALFLR